MFRGPETEKMHFERVRTGFYDKYMSGLGLDIGYQGSLGAEAAPVLATATGVDMDTPGYDGINLPFIAETQDYVYTSHVLEHLSQPYLCLSQWFRVLKVNGHLIVIVPHKLLYEKKAAPPSRFNEDHKTFFTPWNLLHMVETALPENSFRVRLLQDNDQGFDYKIPPEIHSNGAYEIVLVIQKIKRPEWTIR